MSETSATIAAWLLTYALHSTLLLAAAALLTARWVRGEAWRETLWKAALVGGLVTASVQTMTSFSPLVGRVAVAGVTQADAADPAPAPAVEPSREVDARTSNAVAAGAAESTATGTASSAPSVSDPASPAPAPLSPPAPRIPLPMLALLAWGTIAAALLVRLAWRQVRLERMLRGRVVVTDPAVLAMMAGLRRNAGFWRPVHLTSCPAAPTPLALGGGEICLPPRFLVDLDPEQQRSALAHELAHLARRDPAWHFAIGILQALFFFQPLNHVARARLRESAEFLCDAWAARQTGSPLGLARCLAEVASWVAPGRSPIPAGTMAMAEGGSPLVQRVQRLTAWRPGAREASGALRLAGALALVAAAAAVAPAVASTDATARPEGTASTASTASAPSTASTASTPSAASAAAAGAPDTAALAVTDSSVQGLTIIRHPNPSEPLPRRWSWAVDQIARRGLQRAWIAWSVPTTLSPGPTWIADDSEEGRTMVNRLLGAPADHSMMLFTVAGDGELEYAVGHAAMVDLSRHPVLWLGPARRDESFAELRRMADGQRDPGQRARLVEAVGIHDAAGVVPYLAAVLGRDGSNGVRKQAASGLGRNRTDEALEALRTAAERDGSDDVRRQAVEAIGQMGTAQSSAVLVRIAWTHANPQVARQAAESLGRLPAEWAAAPLDSIARRHPNSRVAHQAVESLGGYPDAVTGGYLRRIARSHPNPRISQEAADQLPDGGRSDRDDDPNPELDPGHDPDWDELEIAIGELEPALRVLSALHDLANDGETP